MEAAKGLVFDGSDLVLKLCGCMHLRAAFVHLIT
jgi:hypothetical protein